MLLGWIAMYFAFRDDWWGIILAVGTTVGGFMAVERGQVLGRERRGGGGGGGGGAGAGGRGGGGRGGGGVGGGGARTGAGAGAAGGAGVGGGRRGGAESRARAAAPSGLDAAGRPEQRRAPGGGHRAGRLAAPGPGERHHAGGGRGALSSRGGGERRDAAGDREPAARRPVHHRLVRGERA